MTSKRWKSRFRYIWHRRSATLSSEEEGLLRPLTKEEVKPEHSNWRIRHFLQTYKLPELEQWFDELLDAWFIWAEFQYQWQKARDA